MSNTNLILLNDAAPGVFVNLSDTNVVSEVKQRFGSNISPVLIDLLVKREASRIDGFHVAALVDPVANTTQIKMPTAQPKAQQAKPASVPNDDARRRFQLTSKGKMDLVHRRGKFSKMLIAIESGVDTIPKLAKKVPQASPNWLNKETWRAAQEGLIEEVRVTA